MLYVYYWFFVIIRVVIVLVVLVVLVGSYIVGGVVIVGVRVRVKFVCIFFFRFLVVIVWRGRRGVVLY